MDSGRLRGSRVLAALTLTAAIAALNAPRADAGQFNVMLCAAGNNAQSAVSESNTPILSTQGYCGSTSGEPAGESGYLRLQTNGAAGNANAGAEARFYWNAPAYLNFKQAGGYTRQPDLTGDGQPDIASGWRVRFDLDNQATISLNQGVGSGNSGVAAEPQKTFGPHLWPFGGPSAFSQFSFRLICPNGSCPKGSPRTSADANTFKFIVGDDYGPGTAITTQNSLTQGGWVRGVQSVPFSSSDAGSGIHVNQLYVDNALVGQSAIGCDTFVSNGVEYGRTFVPCSGGPVGSTLSVNTAGNNPATGQPFGDGLHTVAYCGVDYGGNLGCSSFTGHFDNNSPTGPTNLHASGSVSKFAANWTDPGQSPGSPIASAHYRLLQLTGGSFDSGDQVVAGAEISSLSGRPAGSDGQYRLTVWLEDSAGNVNAANTAVQTFQINSQAPDTSITAGPTPGSYTNQRSATFTYTSSLPETSFECKLDAAGFSACPAAGRTYSALGDGLHVFQVRAVDPSTGPDPSPASRSWTVDATPPALAFTPPSPASGSTTGPAVTFGFLATDASPVTYACSLDGKAAAPCTSPQSFISLSGGAHVFTVQATDAAGNSSSPATLSWSVDANPPETTITAGPTDTSTVPDATPTFAFEASELGTSFACALDSETFAPCDSPNTLPALNDGPHVFQVRATDAVGNVGEPVLVSFTVDTVAPPAPTLSASAPASPANDNSPKIEGSAEAGSAIALYTASDCSGPTAATATAAQLASGLSVSVPDDSSTTFYATAADAVGNTSLCSSGLTYVEDSTPPPAPTLAASVPASPANDNSPKIEGSAEAGSAVALYTASDCAGPTAATGTAAQLASGLSVSVPEDSSSTFYATAADAVGNTSSCSAGLTYVEDSTPPPATIDSGPAGPTNDPRPSFTFSSTDPTATFTCSVDGGTASFGPCSAATSFQSPSNLADGSWTFRAKATDAAGNSTTATRGFTVDTTPPAPPGFTQAPGDPSQDTEPLFEITGEPGGSFECALDGVPYAGCEASYDPGALTYGEHVLKVRESDAVGNVSADTVFPWHLVLFTNPSDPHNCALREFSSSATTQGLRMTMESEVPRLVKVQIFRKSGPMTPKRRLSVFRKRSESTPTVRIVRSTNFRVSRKVRKYTRASAGPAVAVRVVPRVINEVSACNVGGMVGERHEDGYLKRFTHTVRLDPALLHRWRLSMPTRYRGSAAARRHSQHRTRTNRRRDASGGRSHQ